MRDKKQYLRDYRENGIANCLPEMPEEMPGQSSAEVFTGRIKMVNPERGFGFLIYDHDGNRHEVFFHFSDVVEGKPEARVKATFDIRQDRDGRPIAGNVRVEMPNIQRTPGCRGQVVWFNKSLCYGFLRDSEKRGIFVPYEGIIPNAAGHRCFILNPGTEVYFTLNEYVDRTTNKFFASEIRLDRDGSSIDSEQTEFSKVMKWSRVLARGIALRSCQVCRIQFKAADVITEGLEFLAVNDWIQHTLSITDGAWAATSVTLFEPGFQAPEPEPAYEPGSPEAFFAAAEIPAEPSPAPAETRIYSPEERRMSLRDIIRRRNKSRNRIAA